MRSPSRPPTATMRRGSASPRFVGVSDPDCLSSPAERQKRSTSSRRHGADRISERGDEIVVTALEHHANFVPWQQIAIRHRRDFKICELTADGRIDLDCLSGPDLREDQGRRNQSRLERPRHDQSRLLRSCESCAIDPGAIVVCDGAQGVPHLRVGLRFDLASISTRSAATRCAGRWG